MATLSDSIRARFQDHIVVCDGAMGSELLSRLPPGSALDLAAEQHPDDVLAVHLSYLEAGAELLDQALAVSRTSAPFTHSLTLANALLIDLARGGGDERPLSIGLYNSS